MTCLRHDEKTAKQQETDSSNFPLPTNHSSLWFDRLANHSLLLTSLLEKDIPLKKIITRKTSSELQNFGDFLNRQRYFILRHRRIIDYKFMAGRLGNGIIIGKRPQKNALFPQ